MIFIKNLVKESFVPVVLFFSLLILSIPGYPSDAPKCPNQIPVVEYIQSLETRYNVKFTYSYTMWKDLKICPSSNIEGIGQAIEKLKGDLPVTIKQAKEGVYILIPVRTQAKLKVMDKGTNELIPVAYIQINQKNKELYFANGQYFEVPDLLPSDQLVVEASFYEPKAVAASSLFNGKNEVALENKVIQLDQVIVIPAYMTKGIDSRLNDQSLKINILELSSIAGETDGDIYQVLKAIPGLSSPTGKPGSIILRGGLFDLNAIQFDGIPIYHTGHLFGAFSPFNPGIVQDVIVHRNSVPIERGGKVGGMIDIHTRTDILDSLEGGVHTNLVFSGLDMSTPIIKNKLGILVSARTSNPFFKNSPKLKEITELCTQGSVISPVILEQGFSELALGQSFMDANAKIVYKPTQKNTLSLSAIYIDNDIDFDILRYDLEYNRIEEIDFQNSGITLEWQKEWPANLRSEIALTSSKFYILDDFFQQGATKDSIGKVITYTINDLKFNSLFEFSLNSKNKIKTGFNSKYQKIAFTFDNPIIGSLDSSNVGLFHAGFLNYERVSWSKLISNIGLRGNYWQNKKNFTLDGKIGLTYLAHKNAYLKTAFSQNRQYLRYYLTEDFEDYLAFLQFWNFAANPGEIMVGRQAMLGIIFKKKRWLIDIEAYHKSIVGLPKPIFQSESSSGQPTPGNEKPTSGNEKPTPGREQPSHETEPNPSGQENTDDLQLNDGLYRVLMEGLVDDYELTNLKTKGIDVLVKKKWNQIDTWISYSLGYSYLDSHAKRLMFYDRRHEFNFTGIVPTDRWTFSINWNYCTGLPVIEIQYEGNPDNYGLVDLPYEDRYPANHQLDVSITAKILKKQKMVDGVLGLSILNVYNRKNIVNNFNHVKNYYDILRYGIGFAPNLQVELFF